MNLPNKLTMLRVILIPFFVAFMLADICGAADFWIALAIFIVASLTDLLDGKIARKYNLVTNFGKFMDPLADKLLVCSAMICLIELDRLVTNFGKLMDPLADKLLVSAALICLSSLGRLATWIVIVIISREFIISGLRQIAAEAGIVIAASYWGKYKTTFQMIMICLLIVNLEVLSILTTIVTWVAVILTIVSLVDYMVKNRKVFLEDK